MTQCRKRTGSLTRLPSSSSSEVFSTPAEKTSELNVMSSLTDKYRIQVGQVLSLQGGRCPSPPCPICVLLFFNLKARDSEESSGFYCSLFCYRVFTPEHHILSGVLECLVSACGGALRSRGASTPPAPTAPSVLDSLLQCLVQP